MRLIEKLPIVANAGFNTPGVELLGLKLICLRGRARGRSAKASAPLTTAEAKVVIPPGTEGKQCVLRDIPFVDEIDRIAAESKAIEKP